LPEKALAGDLKITGLFALKKVVFFLNQNSALFNIALSM
jgi:hypothetical protein